MSNVKIQILDLGFYRKLDIGYLDFEFNQVTLQKYLKKT
jgi:hypothetical protein